MGCGILILTVQTSPKYSDIIMPFHISACGSVSVGIVVAQVQVQGRIRPVPTIVLRPHGDCNASHDEVMFTGCLSICDDSFSPRSIVSLIVCEKKIFFSVLFESRCGLLVVMECGWNKCEKRFSVSCDPTQKKYLGTRLFNPIVDCCYLVDYESFNMSATNACCTEGKILFEANKDCTDENRRVYSLDIGYQCCGADPICPTLVPDVNDIVFCFTMGKGVTPVLVKKVCDDKYQVIDPCSGRIIITTEYETDGRYVFAKNCKKFVLFCSDSCVQFIEICIPLFGEVVSLFVDCDTVRLTVKRCDSPLLEYIVLSRPAVEEYILVIQCWKIMKYSVCDASPRGEVCCPGWSQFVELVKSKGCIQDVQIDDFNGNIVVMVTGKTVIPPPCGSNDGPTYAAWIAGFYCDVECGVFIIKCANAPCIKFGCSIVCNGNDFSLGNCTWVNVCDPCSDICIGSYVSTSSVDNCHSRRLFFDGCTLKYDEDNNCTDIMTGIESCVFIDDRCSCVCWKAVPPPPGCPSFPTSSWRQCWYVDVIRGEKICIGTTICPPTQCDVSDIDCNSFYLSIDVNFDTHCREVCIYLFKKNCHGEWEITLCQSQLCAGMAQDLCGTECGSFSWLSRTCVQSDICAVYDGVPQPITGCKLTTSCDLLLNPPQKKYNGLRLAAVLFVKCEGKYKVLAVVQNPSSSCQKLELYRCPAPGSKCKKSDSCYENDDCVGPKNKLCVEFQPCDSKTICLGVTSKVLCTAFDCSDVTPVWSIFESLLGEWCVSATGTTLIEAFFGCTIKKCRLFSLEECDWPCDCPLVPQTCHCSYSLCVSCVNCEGSWTTHCVTVCDAQAQCYVRKVTCSRKLTYQTVISGCC